MNATKTRILIVDDHPLMRKGIAMTLQEELDFDVVGQASDAESALSMIDTVKPNLAILDISLPGINGIELLKHIRSRYPDILCLMVSRHDEDLYAERAIRAGARGYLMKVDAGENIVKAVRTTLTGGLFLSNEINQKILMNLAGRNTNGEENLMDLLSDRELEVFESIGMGISTKEIAERLHVSVKTVESYRSRIKQKLNIENATELMKKAVQWIQQ